MCVPGIENGWMDVQRKSCDQKSEQPWQVSRRSNKKQGSKRASVKLRGPSVCVDSPFKLCVSVNQNISGGKKKILLAATLLIYIKKNLGEKIHMYINTLKVLFLKNQCLETVMPVSSYVHSKNGNFNPRVFSQRLERLDTLNKYFVS